MAKIRYNFANTLETGDDYTTSFSNPFARFLITGNLTTIDEFDVEVSKPSNDVDRFKPILVGRIGYNNGISGYAPADLKGGPFRFGIGASVNAGFDADADDIGDLFIQADFIMKVHHFSLSGGVYEHMITEGGYWEKATHNAMGFLGQAGFVIADLVEPIARFSTMMPNEGDIINDITGGLTFYFHGHNFKWENNFTSRLYANYTDVIFVSQMQLFF